LESGVIQFVIDPIEIDGSSKFIGREVEISIPERIAMAMESTATSLLALIGM